jgi:hypothetical protein
MSQHHEAWRCTSQPRSLLGITRHDSPSLGPHVVLMQGTNWCIGPPAECVCSAEIKLDAMHAEESVGASDPDSILNFHMLHRQSSPL